MVIALVSEPAQAPSAELAPTRHLLPARICLGDCLRSPSSGDRAKASALRGSARVAGDAPPSSVARASRSAWPAPISTRPASTSPSARRGRRRWRSRPSRRTISSTCSGSARAPACSSSTARDGEFSASLAAAARKGASLAVGAQTRPQEAPPDVDFLFAPLKHARLDYMAQKAVEMGAAPPQADPHAAHPGRAAQSRAPRGQCDRSLRAVRRDLDAEGSAARAARQGARPMAGSNACSSSATRKRRRQTRFDALSDAGPSAGVGLLIGPEGASTTRSAPRSSRSRAWLRLSLGPRVLRADTAAVAALALVQATLGDWSRSLRHRGAFAASGIVAMLPP